MTPFLARILTVLPIYSTISNYIQLKMLLFKRFKNTFYYFFLTYFLHGFNILFICKIIRLSYVFKLSFLINIRPCRKKGCNNS